MGDNLGCPDMVDAAKCWKISAATMRDPSYRVRRTPWHCRPWTTDAGPLDQLREVVQAVNVPVQAVGGLSLEQAIRCPEYGAPLVVLGAPLTIDADALKPPTETWKHPAA